MSLKFTPGPWRFEQYGREGAFYVLESDGSNQGSTICSISDQYGPYKIETEANGRLIASAPTMYAKLQEIHDRLTDFHDIEDGNDGKPHPNWAMRLQSEIRELLDSIEVKS